MKTEIKILEYYLNNNNIQNTIREISKQISSDYKITYQAINNLIKKEIILTKKVGNSTLCFINKNKFTIDIYTAEYNRKEKILKNSNIKLLTNEILRKIKNSNFILLLFGSYAKNKQTTNSDIDLIFISNQKEEFENKLENIFSLLSFKIDYYIFTEKEFKEMRDSKERNIVTEVIENNIILYGIENYYKLKNDN